METEEVSLVRERFLPAIRELATDLCQCGTESLIIVIPKEPAWPIFFVRSGGQEGVCQAVNTQQADRAYAEVTQQRRHDVAMAQLQS